jgi:hypothetical protein
MDNGKRYDRSNWSRRKFAPREILGDADVGRPSVCVSRACRPSLRRLRPSSIRKCYEMLRYPQPRSIPELKKDNSSRHFSLLSLSALAGSPAPDWTGTAHPRISCLTPARQDLDGPASFRRPLHDAAPHYFSEFLQKFEDGNDLIIFASPHGKGEGKLIIPSRWRSSDSGSPSRAGRGQGMGRVQQLSPNRKSSNSLRLNSQYKSQAVSFRDLFSRNRGGGSTFEHVRRTNDLSVRRLAYGYAKPALFSVVRGSCST